MKFLCSSVFVGLALKLSCRPATAFVAVIDRRSLNTSYDSDQRIFHSQCVSLQAKPKRGGVVDSYQTVSVNCAKCGEKLFRYKKKNGTKSNLVKCYVERISEDSSGLLNAQESSGLSSEEFQWSCPKCNTKFARASQIHGLPALKMVGGKVRMTKK
jgi:endogenous inhibitor of DNA gyrase (YacG/DUF329 family)